jgi:hypothetical protein
VDGNADAVFAWLGALIPEYAAADGESAADDASAAPTAIPAASVDDALGQHCPKCRTGRVHRSKARNVFERVQRGLKDARLYRCDDCGWRGWLTSLVYVGAEPIAEHEAPDLTALDRAAPSGSSVRRASFSPRDLQ